MPLSDRYAGLRAVGEPATTFPWVYWQEEGRVSKRTSLLIPFPVGLLVPLANRKIFMGMFSTCPACGSDWCTGCKCVREQYEGQVARLRSALVTVRAALIEIRDKSGPFTQYGEHIRNEAHTALACADAALMENK